MARIESVRYHTFRSRSLRIGWLVSGGSAVVSSLLLAMPAWGGVGLGATATYPPVVSVGQTNLPVSIDITNPSGSGSSTTLTSIKHTPSCGMAATPCPGGSADPGVFLIKGPANGRTGTACAGVSFTIGSPDVVTGELAFTPASTVTLMPGDSCAIDFRVDVLRLPAKNASAGPNIETAVEVRVSGTDGASGTGGTLVTVLPQTVHIPAPALSPMVLGLLALLLTGFGVVRLVRRPARALHS